MWNLGIVEGISQPWHSLAPSLGAESQGSCISWQQVYSRVDSRSMEVRNARITGGDLGHLILTDLRQSHSTITMMCPKKFKSAEKEARLQAAITAL